MLSSSQNDYYLNGPQAQVEINGKQVSMVALFATHIRRVDLDLDWTDKILLNYVNGSITTDLGAAHMDSLATLRSVTR